MNYVDGKNRDSHIDKFNGLAAKLANYGVNLTDENKIALITRFLPESFSPNTITLSTVGVQFNQFLAAIRSKIGRRKSNQPQNISEHQKAYQANSRG